MCGLCSTDKKELERAKEYNRRISDKLYQLGDHYQYLAMGTIKPHSEEMKKSEPMAKMVIRILVEDWV